MGIKSILCIFGGAAHELGALNAAMTLAQSNSAQIRVLHISPDPGAYIAAYGGEVMAVNAVLAALEKKNAERLATAKHYAASSAQTHQVPLDTPEALAHHASAQFLHQTGTMDHIVAQEGRVSDLIVISRGAYAASPHNDDAVMAALFNTGRPVLLTPKAEGGAPSPWRDKTIALAWNGSLEAARAMSGAMPLLARAENLHVLIARRHGGVVDLTGEARLLDYLKVHGLHTEIIAVEFGRHSEAELALAQARELKADILVMGAYGRSRLREMMLGGFTEHVLQRADIPLLLSH